MDDRMLDLLRLRVIRLEKNSFGIEDRGFNLSYRIELNPEDALIFKNNPKIVIDKISEEKPHIPPRKLNLRKSASNCSSNSVRPKTTFGNNNVKLMLN